MIRTPLFAALALSPLWCSAAQTVAPVTPMTVDNVATYDTIRPEADFIKRVDMIPMRDGVKLYTVTVMKKGTKNAPILLSRTPYDAKGNTNRAASQSVTEIMQVMDA
ncbi:MAG: glutaryl-7-ACA acylase, partial [Gammaproteobacteria bacterium]|nr:glutaryl-7-ACA acylase [Gammaproteobacteria bacterium]